MKNENCPFLVMAELYLYLLFLNILLPLISELPPEFWEAKSPPWFTAVVVFSVGVTVFHFSYNWLNGGKK